VRAAAAARRLSTLALVALRDCPFALLARTAERMDPSAVLRDSYPLTDRIEHFIARAPGNQALTNRLSCVTYLIYGVRSRLQASVRDCPEGSRSDRCEQLSLLLSQMVETSWVSCALCLPARREPVLLRLSLLSLHMDTM
jgi:hypothetical protein